MKLRLLWCCVLCLVCGLSEAAGGPSSSTLRIVSPEETTTTHQVVDVIGRAPKEYVGGTAEISGVSGAVLSTAVFGRAGVPLQMGDNQIPVRVQKAGLAALTQTVLIRREPEAVAAPLPSTPLVIDAKSIVPKNDLVLRAGDDLEVGFRASTGAIAEFRLGDGPWQPMDEAKATSGTGTGKYHAAITVAEPQLTARESSGPILLRLRDAGSSAALYQETAARVLVWPSAGPVRLARVKDNEIGHLNYGLTDVRLGGPYLGEVSSGTLLRLVGRQGSYWKVQLCPDQVAWIGNDEVEPALAGTAVPHLEFTDMTVSSTVEGHGVISIPYDARVPYSVSDEPAEDGNGTAKVHLDLYGAHEAVTWITHRGDGEVIRQATVAQVGTDHLRITAHMAGRELWGYRVEVTTGALRLIVRKAPQLAAEPMSPLHGLTVAIEQGHGGANRGAIGAADVYEKEITYAVGQALADELTSAGAKPVLLRKGDEFISMMGRGLRALASNPDLFVSIHCNSSGGAATHGDAVFYKQPYDHQLALAVHRRILQETGLASFGVIGNFNYTPIRITSWMPTVLVEQAFLSNPEEEAQLLDPAFQRKMARGIRLGLEDYLRSTQQP